jgi:hypothetical protein
MRLMKDAPSNGQQILKASGQQLWQAKAYLGSES